MDLFSNKDRIELQGMSTVRILTANKSTQQQEGNKVRRRQSHGKRLEKERQITPDL